MPVFHPDVRCSQHMTFAVNFFSNTRVSDLWVDAQIFPDNNSRLVFLATAHELKF